MIVLLADLLRLSLDQDDRHLVPLRNELEFLERYLAIEKIRFRDRLKVEIDIESSCFAAQVPRLILQPLVENSVAPRNRPKLLRRPGGGARTRQRQPPRPLGDRRRPRNHRSPAPP